MINIDEVARTVSHSVAAGREVAAHTPVRVGARELTIEFDPEPYAEVPAAFREFCRVTGTQGRLAGYDVRPVAEDNGTQARVTATVDVDSRPFVGHGVAGDVVAASVQAFAAAVAQVP